MPEKWIGLSDNETTSVSKVEEFDACVYNNDSPDGIQRKISTTGKPKHVENLIREIRTVGGSWTIDIVGTFTNDALKLLLCELLDKKHQVRELHKQQASFDEEELQYIITSVTSTVEKLWLSPAENDENSRIIDAIRLRTTPLELLEIRQHITGPEDIDSISTSLFNINQLILICCDLQPRYIKILAEAIKRLQRPLYLLNLSGNLIGTVGIRSLCESDCISNIEQLCIPGCNVQSAEIRILSHALRELKKPIKLIDISNNPIGSRGVEYIALCLNHAESFLLCECLLQPPDVEVLSRSVKSRRKPLLRLDLSGNPIGWQGIQYLSGCVTNVTNLGLKSCSVLPFDVRCLLSRVKEQPCWLKQIDLRGNPVELSDAESSLYEGINILCCSSVRRQTFPRINYEKPSTPMTTNHQTLATKRTVSATIGPLGGCIQIGGSTVTIPRKALEENTQIVLTSYYAPNRISKKLSSVLFLYPEGLNFNNNPIDVILSTCHVTDGKRTVRQTADGKKWETIKTIRHSTQRQICVQTDVFVGIMMESASNVIHSHLNKILVIAAPVLYSTDPDEINLSCFIFDDTKDAVTVEKMTIVHKKRFVIRNTWKCPHISVSSKQVDVEPRKLHNEGEFPEPWVATLKLRKRESGIFFQEIRYRLELSSQRLAGDFFFVPRDFQVRKMIAFETVSQEPFEFVDTKSPHPPEERLKNGESFHHPGDDLR